jgi:hypothetical protein
MGISRKYFLMGAKGKEREDWIDGLTHGDTKSEGWRMENRSLAYLWGSCVRDAFKARRLFCDFQFKYNFGDKNFQRLLDEAVKLNFLSDK